jgi:hypothetical protein
MMKSMDVGGRFDGRKERRVEVESGRSGFMEEVAIKFRDIAGRRVSRGNPRPNMLRGHVTLTMIIPSPIPIPI